MSKLSDLINAEDSFLVKLRCENTFDETKYLEIKNQILIEIYYGGNTDEILGQRQKTG